MNLINDVQDVISKAQNHQYYDEAKESFVTLNCWSRTWRRMFACFGVESPIVHCMRCSLQFVQAEINQENSPHLGVSFNESIMTWNITLLNNKKNANLRSIALGIKRICREKQAFRQELALMTTKEQNPKNQEIEKLLKKIEQLESEKNINKIFHENELISFKNQITFLEQSIKRTENLLKESVIARKNLESLNKSSTTSTEENETPTIGPVTASLNVLLDNTFIYEMSLDSFDNLVKKIKSGESMGLGGLTILGKSYKVTFGKSDDCDSFPKNRLALWFQPLNPLPFDLSVSANDKNFIIVSFKDTTLDKPNSGICFTEDFEEMVREQNGLRITIKKL